MTRRRITMDTPEKANDPIGGPVQLELRLEFDSSLISVQNSESLDSKKKASSVLREETDPSECADKLRG